MRRHTVAAVAALGFVALLAACGGPTQPADEGLREVRATVSTPAIDPVLGAGLVFLDGAVLNASSFAEAYDGVWLAGFAPLGADGIITIPLPSGADVPPSLMAPAADLLDPNWFEFTCTLDVADADVSLTPVVILEVFGFPGITALTANGAAFTIATTQPFDPAEDDYDAAGYVTVVYADAATIITTPPGGCVVEGADLIVDVELSHGWTQLAWSLTVERDPVTDVITDIVSVLLTNDDTSPVHLAPQPFYLGDEFASGAAIRRLR